VKTQMKWNRSSALLGTALVGAVALAGCPKKENVPAGFTPLPPGPVVTVNGTPIERVVLHSHLEASQGEAALRSLIDIELVAQELKNKKLDVTDAEVNAAIQLRSAESEVIAKALVTPGAQQDAVKRQIRYQLGIDKLVTADIKVDEAKLKAWFEKAKARYDVPERVKLGVLISSTKIRADVMAKALKDGSKTFLNLVDEQKAAKDAQAPNNQNEMPRFMLLSELPPELRSPISKLKEGEHTAVTPLGPAGQQVYMIVRLVKREEGKKATLEELRAQVENDYKLELLAREEVKKDPGNPNFDTTIVRVEAYMENERRFGRIPGVGKPTRNEIISFINQIKVGNMLEKLRNAAKLEVNDTTYAKIGEDFKARADAATAAAAQEGAAPEGGMPQGAPPAAAPPSGGAEKAPAAAPAEKKAPAKN